MMEDSEMVMFSASLVKVRPMHAHLLYPQMLHTKSEYLRQYLHTFHGRIRLKSICMEKNRIFRFLQN